LAYVRPSVNLSVRLFVRYQSYEQVILKTNEPIVLQIGTCGPRGKGM